MINALPAQRKIIMFELNEVPYRVIDYFVKAHPDSTLARCLHKSLTYETYTEDVGHLSPWRTWPTLHRGVIDEKHFVKDFGQDLTEVDKEFPPLWRILADSGVSTGICGTLHTYPMPVSLENYAFYLPDTFAAGSECFPKSIEAFQEFNLRMARASARNVDRRIPWSSALKLLMSLPDLGFKLRSAVDIGQQLLAERQERWKVVRRRTYQSVLAFDVFMRQLNKTKPAFASFFTNHVASSLHRYWAAAFPNDYDEDEYEFTDEWARTYRSEIEFAMGKADEFLTRLVQFVDQNPQYQIWIVTSMGQEATVAKECETQLYLTNAAKLMGHLEIRADEWEERPAMLPQFNVMIAPSKVAMFRTAMQQTTIAGKTLSFREKDNGFFSLDFGHSNLAPDEGIVLNGVARSFREAGLENVEIQDRSGTTAYHIPQGCMIVYDPQRNTPSGDDRTSISTLDIAPTILKNFGIAPKLYMRRAAQIAV